MPTTSPTEIKRIDKIFYDNHIQNTIYDLQVRDARVESHRVRNGLFEKNISPFKSISFYVTLLAVFTQEN